MKLTVALRRVGTSRVSNFGIPFQARVLQGNKTGDDLIEKFGLCDMANAKSTVQDLLESKFRCAVTIDWQTIKGD